MTSSEILINQLFAGGYLSEGGNIGHEVINLFEDDAGDRYLYITPSGEVKGHDVESVVFVRHVHAHKTVEVVAVALGLSAVSDESVSSIKYGGVSLPQIFRGNTYHGGEDVFSSNVTYKADLFLVPAGGRRILISIEPDFDLSSFPGSLRLNSEKRVVVPQGLRSYYSEENDGIAYAQLSALISDDSLWECADGLGKLVSDGAISCQRPSFLEIIGKEDDELVFSNLLAYYFDFNHSAFKDFAADKTLLDIPNVGLDFSVVRESKYSIDIWIESADRVIVIENKIKSGINGLKNEESQLDRYRREAQRYAIENGKAVGFYLFLPDYNDIDLSRFDDEGVWRVIPYSAIYRFFADNAASYISDWCYPEFLMGLERQSMTMSELNFRTMRSRFLRKIALA